jgi:hypothetical protein
MDATQIPLPHLLNATGQPSDLGNGLAMGAFAHFSVLNASHPMSSWSDNAPQAFENGLLDAGAFNRPLPGVVNPVIPNAINPGLQGSNINYGSFSAIGTGSFNPLSSPSGFNQVTSGEANTGGANGTFLGFSANWLDAVLKRLPPNAPGSK